MSEAATEPCPPKVSTASTIQSTAIGPLTHEPSGPQASRDLDTQGQLHEPTTELLNQNDIEAHRHSTTDHGADRPSTQSTQSVAISTPKAANAKIVRMPRPSRSAGRSRIDRLRDGFLNWWMWERLSMFLSLLSFMGVIVL